MEFICRQCKSKTKINLVKMGEKATIPEIEYCPVCGMSEEMIKSAEVENG